MSLEAWFTVTIVGLLFIALVKNLAPPDVIFLAATTVLAVAGIISPE